MRTSALLLLLAAAALASPAPAAPAATDGPSARVLEEDAHLTLPELVVKYGYPVEKHAVTTEDGYVLTLFRIPHGRAAATGTPNARPVFLQHGLLESADDWILTRPDKALGYILADAGYDVWLGNARGNKWSRDHISLNPDTSKAFWDFSWHEMGVYDLPAAFDYILAQTGAEQLHYVGHSMGTTMFFAMAAARPEYNSRVRAAFALAPVAFMPHTRTPALKTIAGLVHNRYDLFKLLGVMEFLPANDLYGVLGERACGDAAPTQSLCTNSLFLICGFDSDQLNATFLPLFMSHDPAGTSSKTLIHYAQSIASGRFAQFDYGALRNLLTYGSRSPPDYDLSGATAPIALHWAANDWMSVPEDVSVLEAQLPNLIGSFRVPYDKFNHLDFIMAVDVKELLYDSLIALMDQY